jgi:MFS family permease
MPESHGFFGAIESLYFFGHSVLYVTLLLYLLIGMAYTNITIGMNALLYRFLPKEGQGGTLGVYSALNSIAMFLGSFLRGYISFFLDIRDIPPQQHRTRRREPLRGT